MPIDIRTPSDDDVEAIFQADGRAFGWVPTAEEIAERRDSLEFTRFRVAFDGPRVVGTSGAFTFDITMPGGATIPVSGVTWVGMDPTYRRQGIMSRMLEALHDDARDRGEPAAVLTASESGIYGRFGYGVASHVRIAAISKHQANLRADAPGSGRVWYADTVDELRAHVPPRYDTYRRATTGEVSRNATIWNLLFTVRAKEMDGLSPTFWLLHADGYACYRVQDRWNDGHPAHRVEVTEFVALSDAARGALWRQILSTDLAGEFTTRTIQLDDPLVHWLQQPRAVRTTTYNDWLWVKPLDVAALARSRTYGIDGRLVIEVSGARFAIDSTDGRTEVAKVRSRPDISTDDAGFGAILLGGPRPSALARAGRLRPANDRALRLADAMFAAGRLPFSQTPF